MKPVKEILSRTNRNGKEVVKENEGCPSLAISMEQCSQDIKIWQLLKGASSTQTTPIGGLSQTPNLNQPKEILPMRTEKSPLDRDGREAPLKVADQLGVSKPITMQEVQIHKKLDMDQQKNKKEWVNLFADNNLTTKDMNLKYVAPTLKEGEKIIELDSEKIDRETTKWKHSIILYVVGESPTIGALDRFIAGN